MPTLLKRLRRVLRHAWRDERDALRLLGEDAIERLTTRVAASERLHRGEIRICIESGLPLADAWQGLTPRARALRQFADLGVWDTEANNGVLIYLLLADHAIEVVADRGLAQLVPESTWRDLVAQMGSAFRGGDFEAGLTQAVAAVDQLLQQHFPARQDDSDRNELPNRPVLR